MEGHEYKMSDAVTSRETDVMGLFYAADGNGVPTNADDLGIDADDLEESAREALDSYALSVTVTRTLTVTLGVGGPTSLLSAVIERNEYGWERMSGVTFFDSWAVPNETLLSDESALVRLFDEYLETYSES